MTAADDIATVRRYEPDYIDRTIQTVRVHLSADNCWPQWANILADEIEDLRAALARVEAENERLREALEFYGGHIGNCGLRPDGTCPCGFFEALSGESK